MDCTLYFSVCIESDSYDTFLLFLCRILHVFAVLYKIFDTFVTKTMNLSLKTDENLSFHITFPYSRFPAG